MNHELIDRYIYAVTKRMDYKQREDVAQELHSLIEDMLAERCRDMIPTEKDIRVILTELGTPQELYAEYDPDARKSLIGQPYFTTYKMVLRITWVAVAAGMGVSSLILLAMGQWSPMEMVGNFLANAMQGLTGAFTVVTLLFAYLDRKGVSLDQSLSDLPPVPKKTKEISVWESGAGIIICVIFLVIFLWVPEVLGVITDGQGGYQPLFDEQAVRGSWYYILAFGLLGITGESVKLLERRYNKKVLTVTVITNCLSAITAIAWLTGKTPLHADYSSYIHGLFAGNDFAASLLGDFHLFFLGVLLLALAMDTAETVYRTLKQ